MALTRYLTSSRTLVGQYLWQQTQHATLLTRAANQRLAQAVVTRPTDGATYPWGSIAYAVPYLLRATFSDFTPRSTTAFHGAETLTLLPDTPYAPALIAAVFAHAEVLLAQEQQAPEELARLAYVLGLCEEVWRSPRFILGPLYAPMQKRSLAELLALPEERNIEDLLNIHTRFLLTMGNAIQLPHILLPNFGKHWLAGSGNDPLIVGDELLLLKTTTTSKIDATWLRELLGYMLLDQQDRYSIHHVGLYLARQAVHLRWEAEAFVATLRHAPSQPLAIPRQEFAVLRALSRGRVVSGQVA